MNGEGKDFRGRPSRAALFRRVESEVTELQARGGLPQPDGSDRVWEGLWLEETHHSTAIEGNTLALRQVEALLADDRAVGGRELREYMEVRGYAAAARWVYEHARSSAWTTRRVLTRTEIRHVHQLCMGPVWDVAPHEAAGPDERPGAFRRHDIRSFPSGMTPPPWPDVPAQLDSWTRALDRLRPRTPEFIERLVALHAEFERIHPFLDGNGRAGRLVLNLILIRGGYPPAVVSSRRRREYLRALGRADAGDAGTLGEMIARAVLDGLYRFAMPATGRGGELAPLAAFADERINVSALRNAALRGRLEATKGPDGLWRSTRAWVDEYLEARYRRGHEE